MSRLGIALAAALTTLIATVVAPATADAHGLVDKQDLPIPAWLFTWAAAAVLFVSFVGLAALWARPRLQEVEERRVLAVRSRVAGADHAPDVRGPRRGGWHRAVRDRGVLEVVADRISLRKTHASSPCDASRDRRARRSCACRKGQWRQRHRTMEHPRLMSPRSATDPSPAAFARLMAEDDGEPITMLNLLRFVEGGRDVYRRYIDRVTPLIEELGGRVLYAGECDTPLVPEDGSGWDAVVVVRYPNRQALVALAQDPRYEPELARMRSDVLKEAVLETTKGWSA